MEKTQVKEIAENLALGMRCFVQLDTKEIKVIPDVNKNPDIDSELWYDAIEEIENNLGDYQEIKGMDSNESFLMMEEFAEMVGSGLKEKLINALNRPKPFRNFKFVIDNSGEYREMSFKFKDEKMMEWVEQQVQENGL